MLPVHYIRDAVQSDIYDNILSEINHLNWCRPPSGIPGNRTPRNVAIIGDGSNITPEGLTNPSPYSQFVYPMFQTAKDYGAVNIPKTDNYLVMNNLYKGCVVKDLEIFVDISISVRANKDDIKKYSSKFLEEYLKDVEKEINWD